MLKIKPEFDENIRASLCAMCGTDDVPGSLFYSIEEVGSGVKKYDVGICVFRLTVNGGEIIKLKNVSGCFDVDALVIAARAALDFIESHSKNKTALLLEENEYLAKALGFIKIGGVYRVDLTDYFKPCEGHK